MVLKLDIFQIWYIIKIYTKGGALMDLNESLNSQFYALGRAFRLLMETAKGGRANQADYQNALLNPVAGLAISMRAILSVHKLTPEIDKLVAMLLENVEESTLIEYSNRSIPKDLQLAWQVGYENGTIYSFSKSKLEAVRKSKNLTQKELADLVGCSQKDISRWENKIVRPGMDKIKQLSVALRCNTDDIID